MNEQRSETSSGRLKRLAWFISIWAGSVLSLGVVAYLLRLLMNAIGLGK